MQDGRKPSTIFFHNDAGHSDEGKKELKTMFEQSENLFSTPKPTRLIMQLLRLCMNKNAIVLDFMAGSGTTAKAVLSQNKEDKGNRKFILVTNNENNICENVCYPRVKNVIKGYKSSNGDEVKGFGGNLKYFKTDFVDAKPNDKNKKKLTEEATEMLCLKEDTFEEIKIKGFKNSSFRIFKNQKKYTGIIYDSLEIEDFKKAIKDIDSKFSVYVFSLSDDIFDEEFEDIRNKVKLSPIPEAIMRVYRRIFK